MSDLIDRQAAIDALGEEPEVWSGKDEYAQGLNNQWHYDVNALKSLPSAQPEPQWIPVTERLPYPWDEQYLVTLAWGGVGVMEYKSTGFHNYGAFSPVPLDAVTAWMPLPEPYKEGETDG